MHLYELFGVRIYPQTKCVKCENITHLTVSPEMPSVKFVCLINNSLLTCAQISFSMAAFMTARDVQWTCESYRWRRARWWWLIVQTWACTCSFRSLRAWPGLCAACFWVRPPIRCERWPVVAGLTAGWPGPCTRVRYPGTRIWFPSRVGPGSARTACSPRCPLWHTAPAARKSWPSSLQIKTRD